MDDNLCREPNDDPALSHRQGSQVFQSKIPKNQPIKNKFWSDPLKKGKKSWSEPLKKEEERNYGQNRLKKEEERNYGQNRLKTKQKLSRTAKISIWLSGVAITVILSIVAYAGLVIYTRYETFLVFLHIMYDYIHQV